MKEISKSKDSTFDEVQCVDDVEFDKLKKEYIELGSPSPTHVQRMLSLQDFKDRLLSLFHFIKYKKQGNEMKSPVKHMLWCLVNNHKTTSICDICGGHHAKFDPKGFRNDTCSAECAAIKLGNSKKGIPRSPEMLQKRKEFFAAMGEDKAKEFHRNKIKKGFNTYKQQTGYSSWQHNPEAVERHNARMMEAEGVLWVSQTENQKMKAKETISKNPNHYENVAKKVMETKAKRGTLPNNPIVRSKQSNNSPEHYEILDSEERLRGLLSVNSVSKVSELLGVDNETVRRFAKNYNIEIVVSYEETTGQRQIREYIESIYDGEVIKNTRSVLSSRKELDIYIPSMNLAIEFNGNYFHSTKFRNDKNYHLQKTLECEAIGVKIIQIFEDEWSDKTDQVKRKIATIMNLQSADRVYARNCSIVNVTASECADFMNMYHIQGKARAKFRYGLVYNNEIVAIMTFNKGVSTSATYLELNRYATAKLVVGGFSKLLNHFWKGHTDIDSIVSFADRRFSSLDNTYTKNGWVLVDTIKPSYTYLFNNVRMRREHFMKNKLKDKLENYDDSLTEEENCRNHGIYRIYDCGLLKYEMKNPYT